MSDEPKHRSRRWIGWALVVVFVLYPLSVGPAARLCTGSDSQWAVAVFRIVYAPIDLVRFLIPPMDDGYFWYESLWLPSPAH